MHPMNHVPPNLCGALREVTGDELPKWTDEGWILIAVGERDMIEYPRVPAAAPYGGGQSNPKAPEPITLRTPVYVIANSRDATWKKLTEERNTLRKMCADAQSSHAMCQTYLRTETEKVEKLKLNVQGLNGELERSKAMHQKVDRELAIVRGFLGLERYNYIINPKRDV